MRNKMLEILLNLRWEVGTKVTCAALLVLTLLPVSGCKPEIAKDWTKNEDGAIMFDLEKMPPIAPQPTYIAYNFATNKVDLSQAGITLPKGITWNKDIPCTELLDGMCTEIQSVDCDNLTPEQIAVFKTIASCDVYKYLTSLDGFPTAPPMIVQSSIQIDTNTVTVTNDDTRTLLLFCADRNNNELTNLKVYSTSELKIDSNPSQSVADVWDLTIQNVNIPLGINKDCFVAIRGYENGVKSQGDAKQFTSSQMFFLLKEKDSLSCGYTTGNEGITACKESPPVSIPEICKYYPMAAASAGNQGKSHMYISGSMCALEYLRTHTVAPVLEKINEATGSSVLSDEAALAYSFPTHTNSVIEYAPSRIEPLFDSVKNEISIHVNGTIDKNLLIRGYYTSENDYSAGTVFIFITYPLTETMAHKYPTYSIRFDDTTNDIVLYDIDPPLNADYTYLIFISKGVDADGKPILTNIIPFMSTVLAMSKGELYDRSNQKLLVTPLSGLSDNSPENKTLSEQAECQRLDLQGPFYSVLGPAVHTQEVGLETFDNILYVAQTGKPNYTICSYLNQ
jgi:hypothetical protein